MKIYQNN